jgi:hypothetical protein
VTAKERTQLAAIRGVAYADLRYSMQNEAGIASSQGRRNTLEGNYYAHHKRNGVRVRMRYQP